MKIGNARMFVQGNAYMRKILAHLHEIDERVNKTRRKKL